MGNFFMKMVTVAVLTPVIIVSGQKAKSKSIDKFQVTELQKPVMSSCKSAMSRYEITFANGASKNNGCACIAKYAGSQVATSDYKAYSAFLDTKLKIGKKVIKDKKQKKSMSHFQTYLKDVEAVKTKYDLSDKRLQTIMEGTSMAISVCGHSDASNGHKLTDIAALPAYETSAKKKAKKSSAKKRKSAELIKVNTPPKIRR